MFADGIIKSLPTEIFIKHRALLGIAVEWGYWIRQLKREAAIKKWLWRSSYQDVAIEKQLAAIIELLSKNSY